MESARRTKEERDWGGEEKRQEEEGGRKNSIFLLAPAPLVSISKRGRERDLKRGGRKFLFLVFCGTKERRWTRDPPHAQIKTPKKKDILCHPSAFV